jgi:hypothetical protein
MEMKKKTENKMIQHSLRVLLNYLNCFADCHINQLPWIGEVFYFTIGKPFIWFRLKDLIHMMFDCFFPLLWPNLLHICSGIHLFLVFGLDGISWGRVLSWYPCIYGTCNATGNAQALSFMLGLIAFVLRT